MYDPVLMAYGVFDRSDLTNWQLDFIVEKHFHGLEKPKTFIKIYHFQPLMTHYDKLRGGRQIWQARMKDKERGLWKYGKP